MKVGDLLAKLAAKSGIDLSAENYKDFARVISEVQGEVHEDQAGKILATMMNLDDAKNNLYLKSYFQAEVLDGFDGQIKKAMDEHGLEDAEKELVKNTTPFKKIGILAAKITELQEKKAQATGKNKGELENQINKLTTQLSEVPKQYEEKIKNINSDWENKLTQTQVRSILNGKKWANDKIPLDVNVETGLIFANRELEKSGAKIVSVNGTMKLVQLKDESLDWISPSNEKPTPEQFLDGILAANKLLAVTTAGTGTTGTGTQNNPPPIPGGQIGNANQSLMASMQDDLKALESIPN